MNLTFYGQSCFAVTLNEKSVLFDPFITPNELARNINIDEIKAEYILVSHAHSDHMADCVSIARRTQARVIGCFEMHEWLNKEGISNTHPMNTGGQWNFGDFRVKCTVAHHSSSFPDGTYGGAPLGFIISAAEGNFYYSGDTSLTMDMQLVPKWAKLNFAVLPIGDNFTMGAEDAVQAAEWIECSNIVGVHYDTFGFIRIDHEKTKKMFTDAGLNLHLLQIGQTISL